MIAVIFEVKPAENRTDDYLEIAAAIVSLAESTEGFVSVERFQSLTDPRKILSRSFFEDEEAVQRWRGLPAHRNAQSRGRSGIFGDYRLRIARVIRDYGMFDRDQAPADSKAAHSGWAKGASYSQNTCCSGFSRFCGARPICSSRWLWRRFRP